MSQILYEVNEHIAELTIQSPPANALSSALINDLEERLNMIEQDATIKTVVIKGDGRVFSAGADIKEFTSLQKEADRSEEHTSELQSRLDLVCRLLLDKINDLVQPDHTDK